MLVIFKNEKGTYSIRPAFIGFIKNNFIRRTLGILFYPFIIIAAIAINIAQAILFFLVVLVRAVWVPLAEIRLFKKTELWKRPRTEADKHSRMD